MRVRTRATKPLCRGQRPQLLLIVADRSRRRFAQFKLVAHPLDLRCLLFQACSEGFNFLLLLRGNRLEILLLLRDGRLLFCNSRLYLRDRRLLFLDLAVLPSPISGEHRPSIFLARREGRISNRFGKGLPKSNV